jgi:hypothetical protein
VHSDQEYRIDVEVGGALRLLTTDSVPAMQSTPGADLYARVPIYDRDRGDRRTRRSAPAYRLAYDCCPLSACLKAAVSPIPLS